MTRITISYKKVTLTEISHACEDNEEYIEEENFNLELHDREVQADERRKFAEWLKNRHRYLELISTDELDFDLAEYEKEQMND